MWLWFILPVSDAQQRSQSLRTEEAPSPSAGLSPLVRGSEIGLAPTGAVRPATQFLSFLDETIPLFAGPHSFRKRHQLTGLF